MSGEKIIYYEKHILKINPNREKGQMTVQNGTWGDFDFLASYNNFLKKINSLYFRKFTRQSFCHPFSTTK